MSEEDIFLSPSKKRLGVLNLTPSPKKSGIHLARQEINPTHSINRGILTATPKRNGRAGAVSPAKRGYTELDRSARKRAILANYARLMDDDAGDDDEDMTVAEKIIQASKRDGGNPVLVESDIENEFNEDKEVNLSPVRSSVLTELKFEKEKSEKKPVIKKQKTVKQKPKTGKFTPTPVPKDEDDFLLKQKKFDDRPLFLDGFEGYFEQHKTKVKTSGNTLSQVASIEYEEYLRNIKLVEFFHVRGKQHLMGLHRKMFSQWYYELLQGFNLCFYGIGSKRNVMLEFAKDFLLPRLPDTKCCVINGYNTEVTIKEVMSIVVPIVLPDHEKHHLSKNSRELMNNLLTLLPSNNRPFMDLTSPPQLVLVINNIDGKQLRDEKFQSLLISLSQLNSIWIIASIDNINSPLMWDSSKLSKLSFLWHDLTTFHNYNVENSFRDVLALGKSSKFSGSKGARYVLSSLTANAKLLYRILVSNQLIRMEEDPELMKRPELRGSLLGTHKFALELKELYQLCLEEFVASNDVSFRTMLHEFVEHKMCNLVKDTSGTEIVFVPFKMTEMEKLLEEELLD